jgi:hypothetical protein
MLNLLFQLLTELFIARPPGLEPGTQSPHARRALADLDSRFFRIELLGRPDTDLGKPNGRSRLGKARTREVAQPSRASQAVDDAFDWSCT